MHHIIFKKMMNNKCMISNTTLAYNKMTSRNRYCHPYR